MRYEVAKDKQHEKAFTVALLEVPPFPENADNIQEVVRTPLTAVVAAVDNGEGWIYYIDQRRKANHWRPAS